MIGCADYHRQVPRGLLANLEYRRRLLALCREDEDHREAVVEICRRDVLFFLAVFGWQFNPLLKGDERIGPFIPWDYQEEALTGEMGIIWCYENNRTAVVEKSRDMGASWLFLFFQVWLGLFHDREALMNISRSKEAVDDVSMDSLFAKLRYIHRYLPNWLTGEVVEQKGYCEYRRTGSQNTGIASKGSSSAGGRASVIFIDEFSKIMEAEEVRRTTASTADCRFFNGTHEGVGTEFFNLTRSPECVQIRMHWTSHPRKNRSLYSWDIEAGVPKFWRYEDGEIHPSDRPLVPFPADYVFDRSGNPSGGAFPGIRSAWYDAKARDIGTARAVAMELDINPTGSSSQFYDPLVIRRMMDRGRDPLWTGVLQFDEQRAIPRRLIAGPGHLALWFDPGMTPEGELCHVPKGRYVIGCDISNGTGASPSCLTVFDAGRGIKVGKWVDNRTDAKQLAWVTVSLCRLFKDAAGDPAFLVWEANGPGFTFGNEVVKEIGFRNIYWKTDQFSAEAKETNSPGWFSTPREKFDLHSEYGHALRAGLFDNPDKGSLEECLNYVHANNTVEHPKAKSTSELAGAGVNHGDQVVADALAWLGAKRYARVVEREEERAVLSLPNSIAGRAALRAKSERQKVRWTA